MLVIDRTNERVQIFDREGNFLDEWTSFATANDLYIDGDDVVYLAEAPRRISILDLDGNVITQLDEEGAAPGQMIDHPHSIWVDSRGDIYMCEVPFTPNRITKYERITGSRPTPSRIHRRQPDHGGIRAVSPASSLSGVRIVPVGQR